jgi:predicted Mrr-cat superfamily restriction endonuclease
MYSENISKGDRVVSSEFDKTGRVMGILRVGGTFVVDADDGFIDLTAKGEWLRVPTPKEAKAVLKESLTFNRSVTFNMLRNAVAACFEAFADSVESHNAVNADAKDEFNEQVSLYNGVL